MIAEPITDTAQLDAERTSLVTMRLVESGAIQYGESDHGSRYFILPNGRRLRVSNHPANQKTAAWMKADGVLEVRIDRPDWMEQLESLTPNNEIQTTAAPPVKPPRLLSTADYHQEYDRVSQSMLKVLDESPSLFEASYITRTYKRPDTADQKLGRVVHAYVLQRDRFDALCPIMPDFHLDGNVDSKGKPSISKSTTYYQERKREFEAANAGLDIIDADELATVKALAEAIWSQPEARAILEAQGENEVVHRWFDRVDRRCMMDAPRPGLRVCADIKTIQGRPTCRNFATTAAKFRWFLQAPFYLDAMNDLYGPDERRFLFIVVGKAPPHEVAIHELDNRVKAKDGLTDHEWAEKRVEDLITDLIRRRITGDWTANYQQGINATPLPSYVRSDFYDVEEAVAE